MLFRALAIAIWNSSLRSFAPYDGRREERHAYRYDEQHDRRDDGQRATTQTRLGRGYRDSDRYEDPPRQLARGRTVALVGLALAALLVVAATIAVEARLAASRTTSPGSGTGQATATITAAVAQTPSASADPTPVNLAALGWTKRGPSPADQIQIAPSAPGTVYATFQNNDSVLGIYVLAPGASAWRMVAYPAGDTHCMCGSWALGAAIWDAGGHPATLWGWSWSNSEIDGLWRQTA